MDMGADTSASPRSELVFILVFVGLMLGAKELYPQDPGKKVEGVVVKVSNKEIVIDIGINDGATEGMEVDFFRKVTVKHPVTGKKVEDRFFIGRDEISQSGDFLSLVIMKNKFSHSPMVGDYAALVLPIIVPLEEGTGEGEIDCPVCPEKSCPVCAIDDESMKVHVTWKTTLGRSIDDRIELWENYLAQNPQSPFAQVIEAQISWLKSLHEAEFKISEQKKYAPVSKLYHQGVSRVHEGSPLVIAVETPVPSQVGKMLLHYRRKGDKYYHSVTMERGGDFNYHYTLPPEKVKRPGIEYFIDLVGLDGQKHAGVGLPKVPEVTLVAKPWVKTIDRTNRSQLSMNFEYVDFYYKDVHRDYFWKLEADFVYKLKTHLYGVRMGIGFFEGQGGSLSDIENASSGISELEPLSFTYLFLELEFKVVKYFYISGRFLAGTTLQETGEEHEGDVILGGQGRIRIGEDWAYLVLAASFTKDAGVEAELSVYIDVLKRFPIAAYVLVTDFPVQEEWGVRLVGQFGWRPLDWFALYLRGGWNIRTIKHEGWSVGAATEFRW